MNKTLIVIDMQNDFVTGVLGTHEAQAIVPNVVKKIKEARENGTKVLFTKDTHYNDYLNSQEGKNLPVPHCIKGTKGHDLIPELRPYELPRAVYEKETFGSFVLAYDLEVDYGMEDLGEIELCGVCTDICVISNALLIKARCPEVRIKVDASCCAGVTPEKHRSALEVMKSCQIEVTGE